MSGSYRNIIVALAGLALTVVALGTGAFFGALNAPHYGYQDRESANRTAQTEQGNPTQIDRDRAGLPYFAERIASSADPKTTDESSKRDLAAQEAAALWGFWMLAVAAIGTVTTIVGTGFLLWQIILTRKAVEDTGAATREMKRSNDIAERAQRPWLAVSIIPQYCNMQEDGFIFNATIVIRNIGQGLAMRVKYSHNCVDDIDAYQGVEWSFNSGGVGKDFEFGRDLLPMEELRIPVKYVLESLAVNRFGIISYVGASYRSIFSDQRHVTMAINLIHQINEFGHVRDIDPLAISLCADELIAVPMEHGGLAG